MIDILVVEGNRADVWLIDELLKSTGIPYHSDVVSNGEKSLHYLRKEDQFGDVSTPRLIVLDMNLPRLNGREFLGQAEDLIDDIFVLVFSGSPGIGASKPLPHKRMTKPSTNEEFDETVSELRTILLDL